MHLCTHVCILPISQYLVIWFRDKGGEQGKRRGRAGGERRGENFELSVKNNSLKKNSMNSFEEKVRVVNRMIKTIRTFLTGEDNPC